MPRCARLKGQERPIQDVHARAEVLAALEAVDLVVVFEEDTPLELIGRVRPTVLVKGGDYRREQVVGHDVVEARRRRGACWSTSCRATARPGWCRSRASRNRRRRERRHKR